MAGGGYPLTIQAPRLLSSVLKWMLAEQVSMDTVTIEAAGSDETLEIGTVLGANNLGTPTVVAGTNTGNGVFTVAPALNGSAKLGAYTLICVATAANAGTFEVLDPAGRRLADCKVGVAYNQPDLAWTLADGSSDFVLGDSFTITVPAGDGNAVPLNLSVLNGNHVAQTVLARRVNVPDGVNTTAPAIARLAMVNEDALIWPTGITTPQTATALAQLQAQLVLGRHQN